MDLQNLIIRKNNFKKADNQPDYIITHNDGKEWITWGACWLKMDKGGRTYLSCSKSKPKEEKEEKVAEILPEDMPF